MMLRKWEELLPEMQAEEVRKYYAILQKKQASLFFKRLFDITVGLCVLLATAIPMAVIAVLIKLDSEGPVFYRQERVTAYGKKFKIHKFRTMVNNADKIGTAVTVGGDSRITKIGAKLRRYRLDELPQVFDLLSGNMSFVGTRPEATKYVEKYTGAMYATLLLPAGITSLASILYKNEAELLNEAGDADKVYVEEILPAKMYYNLKAIEQFSFLSDIKLMIMTVLAVLGKEYKGDYNPDIEIDTIYAGSKKGK